MSDFEDFIGTVFDADMMVHGEHRCFWATSKTPSYPMQLADMQRALRGRAEKALYVGTATVFLSPEGQLRNRGTLFAGLWMVVLDDIGTGIGSKCAPEELPEGLWDAASVVIETSPDNYQLCYILEEPIRDHEHARELVRLVYQAGPWDSGGAMPTKIVRVPAGFNMKEKYADDQDNLFEVRLESFSGNVYTPNEILDMVGAGVGWDDITAGVSAKQDPRRGKGTTPYRTHANLDLHGVVDPVAEWLNDRGMVVNERYPFMDIICPWHEEHTEGGDITAGYAPLGWGDPPYDMTRGFHCFHAHCHGRGSRELIDWVVAMGGPPASVRDPVGALLTRYAFDMNRSVWIDMQSPGLTMVPDRGFKIGNQNKVSFPTPKMSKKGVIETQWNMGTIYGLLVQNEGLLKISGTCYEPGDELIVDNGFENHINDCRLPFYGKVSVNQDDVDKFVDFIKYLMPAVDDAEWFIRHLAMKAQNPKYRGPGVFMYTSKQGTGRGTLSTLLSRLWGSHLVNEPTMRQFVSGITGDGFNSELQALWLFIHEAKDGTLESGKVSAQRYENLKSFIEPRPVMMNYNAKYMGKWSAHNYSSIIICSNHFDGLQLDAEDRRFKRIQNTTMPRQEDYFTPFHEWLEGNWMPSVWQYLLEYDCGEYTGTENLAHRHSEVDAAERLAAMSPIDLAIELSLRYCEEYTGGLLRVPDLVAGVSVASGPLKLMSLNHDWVPVFERVLRRRTTGLSRDGRQVKTRVGNKLFQLRASDGVVGSAIHAKVLAGADDRGEVGALYDSMDSNEMAQYILEAIENLG